MRVRIPEEVVHEGRHIRYLEERGFDTDIPFRLAEPRDDEEAGARSYEAIHQEHFVASVGRVDNLPEMNTSGIVPVEYKVLIRRPDMEKTTDGGIHIPENARKKERFRRVEGVLVAIGGNAFEDWKCRVPVVGDTVRVAKYAGDFLLGDDDTSFQLCHDKDISGIVVAPRKRRDYHESDQPDMAQDGAYSNIRAVPDIPVLPPGSERLRIFMGTPGTAKEV
jgi:co-chaperonin GroES (HSP10)